MAERCIDCKFFHQLKELEKGIWHIKSCCTANAEGGYEGFVLVVTAKDGCEMWQKGEDKWLTNL